MTTNKLDDISDTWTTLNMIRRGPTTIEFNDLNICGKLLNFLIS